MSPSSVLPEHTRCWAGAAGHPPSFPLPSSARIPEKAGAGAQPATAQAHQCQRSPHTKALIEIPPEAMTDNLGITEGPPEPGDLAEGAPGGERGEESSGLPPGEEGDYPDPGLLTYLDELCAQDKYFLAKVRWPWPGCHKILGSSTPTNQCACLCACLVWGVWHARIYVCICCVCACVPVVGDRDHIYPTPPCCGAWGWSLLFPCPPGPLGAQEIPSKGAHSLLLLCQVDVVLHPRFLAELLSPHPELYLLVLAEELEKEEGLSILQLEHRRLLELRQEEEGVQASPSHGAPQLDSRPSECEASQSPQRPGLSPTGPPAAKASSQPPCAGTAPAGKTPLPGASRPTQPQKRKGDPFVPERRKRQHCSQ
ncbi:NUT family member 2B-like [Manis pentadactyla]|uniref:NUT family member 2B-like n=1 Tax=Manis pentadactyla TaxID=143292 RepID=UPI00255CFB93|nr:NUT family member 2B-like [Manis pentadactyla]